MGSECLSGRVEAELELRTLAMPFRRLRQRVSCSWLGAMLMKPRVMLELKIQSLFSGLDSFINRAEIGGEIAWPALYYLWQTDVHPRKSTPGGNPNKIKERHFFGLLLEAVHY